MSKVVNFTTGPKRSLTLRAQQREECLRLHSQGLFQEQIAAQLSISQPQVSRDIAAALGRVSTPRVRKERGYGYVYLARLEGTAFFKIGRSINPMTRFRDMNQGLPIEIIIICALAVSNPPLVERYLLQKFAPQRVKGEWFTLDEKTALDAFTEAAQAAEVIACHSANMDQPQNQAVNE